MTKKQSSPSPPIGKKAPFPRDLKPMLATLVNAPFDNKDWIYEIKWDGYRVLSYCKKGEVELRSRNNLSFNTKFNGIKDALELLAVDAVLDGEIVALNKEGYADFQQLQNVLQKGKDAHLVYYIFDILWYNGRDLTGLPLLQRKELLKDLLPVNDDHLLYSDHIREKGIGFFNTATKHGLEGVMGKDGNSTYTPGARTGSWLKIKNTHRLEAIICGYTEPRRSRKYFGAIILGKYTGKKLVYIGHSGSGFDEKGLKDLYNRLQKLIVKRSPFEEVPHTNSPVTWVRPELVCEVKFAEWTSEKILRQPIFAGLRDDKKAANEKNEKMLKVPAHSKKAATPAKKAAAAAPVPAPVVQDNDALLPNDGTDEKLLKLNKQELKLTHLNKIYWPKEKYTKRDLLNYYHRMADFILPYMKDRPQSLNRHPNGITGQNFYQKDTAGKLPDWLTSYRYDSDTQGAIDFLVCKDEASLLYMANLGCIEMNPWHSRTTSAFNPDWCVIDLDPDTNSFDQVIRVALVIKDILDSLKIKACCKTSGATGLHIYIPLGARYGYEQSRMLARLIVDLAHQQTSIASFTSLERTPAKRKGKIYLDFLQNREIQTLAAPYSVRPRPGATVSTPLHWEEVKKGLRPTDFTILNIYDRVKAEGDLFKPVLGKGIDLEKAVKTVEKLME